MAHDALIVPCARCGAKNRVPKARLADSPVCGRCRSPLNAGGHFTKPVTVTDTTFPSEVLDFAGPVLVDCWAPWCGPCRMIAPVLDELAAQYAGKLKIAKLNVDENPETASRYQIQSIPTMILFKGGRPVDRLVGAVPKGEIERHIRSVL